MRYHCLHIEGYGTPIRAILGQRFARFNVPNLQNIPRTSLQLLRTLFTCPRALCTLEMQKRHGSKGDEVRLF